MFLKTFLAKISFNQDHSEDAFLDPPRIFQRAEHSSLLLPALVGVSIHDPVVIFTLLIVYTCRC